MRAEQMSDALNYLDEELIAEAAEVRSRGAVRRPSWQKWGALAACLAVAVFAGTRLLPGGTLPGPGDPPRPGGSGPSQPVQGGELPTLTIRWDSSGGMGFEGYMAFDISELGGNNPWTEEAELSTLPVYKNPLTYDEQYRATGADEEKMKALLLDVAGKLGLDTQNLPVTDNTPSQEQQQAIREKFAAVGETVPEGYFDPTTLIIEGEGVTVEVDQTLTARIDFDPPVELPQGYNFTHFATREEKRKAAAWLAEEYGGLLSGMAEPTLDQGMGDRNIYQEQSFDTVFYDGMGTLEEQIVNFNFNRVAFYCDDDGKLFLARVFAPDLSQKLGDYPVITPEAAKELLLAGNYATSVPYAMPGEEHIAKVELVYRTSSHEEIWLPYYRFLVYLPEEKNVATQYGMKDYGAYYVPAVEGKYIANMPTYDGGFNGSLPKPAVPEPVTPPEAGQPGMVVPGQK